MYHEQADRERDALCMKLAEYVMTEGVTGSLNCNTETYPPPRHGPASPPAASASGAAAEREFDIGDRGIISAARCSSPGAIIVFRTDETYYDLKARSARVPWTGRRA